MGFPLHGIIDAIITIKYVSKPTWDVDEGSGLHPESTPLKRKSNLSLNKMLISANWLVGIFENLAEALWLALEMRGADVNFGLGITMLVLYLLQVVFAIVLVRPHPKSAYHTKTSQMAGFLFTPNH
jgi:hypothetical protein